MITLIFACGNVTSGDPDAGDMIDAPNGVTDVLTSQPPNFVFVTSNSHTGALNGLAGADAVCNTQAQLAGLDGNYVAWLSTDSVNAVDRLGDARGWVRPDGKPFADTIADLVAGRVFYPPRLSENSMDMFESRLWTATNPDGTYEADPGNCSNWTFEADSSQRANVGYSNGGTSTFTRVDSSPTFTVNSRCDLDSPHLLCFGIDNQSAVSVTAAAGRIAFVTKGRLGSGGGVAAFDALCAGEAAQAGLSGTFLAAVGDSAYDGPSNRLDLTGAPWTRPDGVLIVEQASELTSEEGLLAPIAVTADGEYVDDNVWSGAAGFDGLNPNCTDWTDSGSSGTEIVGRSSLSWISSISFNGSDCQSQHRVYCFEN